MIGFSGTRHLSKLVRISIVVHSCECCVTLKWSWCIVILGSTFPGLCCKVIVASDDTPRERLLFPRSCLIGCHLSRPLVLFRPLRFSIVWHLLSGRDIVVFGGWVSCAPSLVKGAVVDCGMCWFRGCLLVYILIIWSVVCSPLLVVCNATISPGLMCFFYVSCLVAIALPVHLDVIIVAVTPGWYCLLVNYLLLDVKMIACW